MQNITKIIFILLFISFGSCSNSQKEKNGELEFVSIERTKSKRLVDRLDETKGYYYGETVLVKNSPKDVGYAIGDMMIKYIEQYGVDFSNMGINKYIIAFMKYNSDTETYLTQDYRNTWSGVTNSLSDENEYRLDRLILEKCNSIDNKWSQYIYIYEENNNSGHHLKYITDSCVSVIDNQF